MDREDRQLPLILDSAISKLTDAKNSLATLLFKLENEANFDAMTWPSALDSFATISSQINVVMRFLRGDNTPNLRNRILLPLQLNPERDEALAKLTENRVQAFNHEMVPAYLRTKNEPEIEEQEKSIRSKVNSSSSELPKLVGPTNKGVMAALDAVKSYKEQLETDPTLGRTGHQQTHSTQDTNSIIAAIMVGKGLKGPPGGMDPPKQIQQAMQMAQAPGGKGTGPGKVPSTIKTNIKTTTHPYSRN